MSLETNVRTILMEFWHTYPKTADERSDPNVLKVLMKTWWLVLQDLPDEALAVAARNYLYSDAEWRPAPGVLRQAALKLAGATGEQKALEAWNKYGDYDNEYMVRLAERAEDGVAIRAIKAMRARNLPAEASIEQRMAERERAFIEAYQEIAERQPGLVLMSGGNHEGTQGSDEREAGGRMHLSEKAVG